MTIKAIVADPSMPATMRLAEVDEPTPGPREALIATRHVSLNHGDLNDATSGRIPAGGVLGSDVSGVVLRPAPDGSGPGEGAIVVGLAVGAFAERVAVDVDDLTVLPDGVVPSVAAALPVAGLAALRTLNAGDDIRGRRVLVTGSSGGVGGFAVQIAVDRGAHVIASVGSPERVDHAIRLGADEVLIGLDGLEKPVDVVIDNVGGPQLVDAWGSLAPGGRMHSVGWASGDPATLPPYATVGPPKTLSSHLNLGPFGQDLAELVKLVAEGRLQVRIGWQGSVARYLEAAEALRNRQIDGKAVIDMDLEQ